MSAINCIPLKPLSSWRPTNGETKVAPALAASSAWFAEKQSVTLTIVPSPVSALQVLSPSMVSGTLMQRSEEHTSELQSLMRISYAVFCLKKKKHEIDT